MTEELRLALGAALRPVLGDVEVAQLRRLSGGASRETWSFDAISAADVTPLILRRDPPGRPGDPGSMGREARVIAAARDAGLPVPEVLLVDDGEPRWGTPGLVMRRVPGETIARHILRDAELASARRALVDQCGRFLAVLHRIGVGPFADVPSEDPLERLRVHLGEAATTSPSTTFDLAMTWLKANRPPARQPALLHGDFRLGNWIVGPDGLRAVLDWELTHVGEPGEDLGWPCVRAWRFGGDAPVAGLGSREELLGSYAAAGGAALDLDELHWWEVFNTLKWGVMCLHMTAAHLDRAERSIELAAIGRRACEQEWDLLALLAPDDVASAAATRPVATGDRGDGAAGRPTAGELLDAVGEFLTDTVLAQTTGRVGFHARVAANVVGIVRRELELGPPPIIDDATNTAQVARHVAHKLAIANPRHF